MCTERGVLERENEGNSLMVVDWVASAAGNQAAEQIRDDGRAGISGGPLSHKQTTTSKQAGRTQSQGQKAGGFTGAETTSDSQRRSDQKPGRQSGVESKMTRHDSKDDLTRSEWTEAAYILA